MFDKVLRVIRFLPSGTNAIQETNAHAIRTIAIAIATMRFVTKCFFTLFGFVWLKIALCKCSYVPYGIGFSDCFWCLTSSYCAMIADFRTSSSFNALTPLSYSFLQFVIFCVHNYSSVHTSLRFLYLYNRKCKTDIRKRDLIPVSA